MIKEYAVRILLAGVLAFGFVFTQAYPASAWQVTVNNALDRWVSVGVYVQKFPFVNQEYVDFEIAPKGYHTVDTGAWCPSGFTAGFRHTKTYDTIDKTSCLGGLVAIELFPACCWNLRVKLCETNSGRYQFCID